MAHFARVENNIVKQVIVVSNDDCGGGDFPESEAIGQEFIASLGLAGDWLQTSYHANFRGCFAAAGWSFNPNSDEYGEFVAPLPIEPDDK